MFKMVFGFVEHPFFYGSIFGSFFTSVFIWFIITFWGVDDPTLASVLSFIFVLFFALIILGLYLIIFDNASVMSLVR